MRTNPANTISPVATERLFFALWPSAVLAAKLSQTGQLLTDQCGGRASRQDTIHLTLAFLGAVPLTRRPALHDIATSLRVESFTITLDCLDYWAHNRIAWIGCRTVAEELTSLRRQLVSTITDAGISVDRASEPFVPHISIARKLQLPLADLAQRASRNLLPLDWAVDSFCLVRSKPDATGAHYDILHRYPLIQAH